MANNIPQKYRSIVKTALIAAAAIGPVGLFGGIDAVAVGGVWATMFYAIRQKSNSSFGSDPKRIAGAVAMGIVKYYLGCKLASYACFLIPGVGIFAAMGVSSVCNIYFTYNFASILIDLMDRKSYYSDNDIIQEIINLIKKLPSVDEVKEIYDIYTN